MSLLKLDIHHVRNILKESIHPSPGINFIIGNNASGKSSLLEAIFILGRAKSFRSTSIKSVIHFGASHLIVSAQVLQSDGCNLQVGIQLDGKDADIRINQQANQQKSDLAYILPTQLIHPKSYELLDGGAQLRREFLDWGVFNDDKSFLTAWRTYKRAISHRNALLKAKQSHLLHIWDKEVVYYGTIVNKSRSNYLQKFRPIFFEIIKHFLPINLIDIEFVDGWDVALNFEDVLRRDIEKDLRYGFTHSGPHRCDFLLKLDNRLARDFVSRGQLKLIILSLKLAQIQLLTKGDTNPACILIDDFAAELDNEFRKSLLGFLSSLSCQTFITTNEFSDFGDLNKISTFKVFHMEHGHIKPCLGF
ncbi:MAG: DNA replication/repair protein RecF [Methylovulum sp.]|nr:DNA replication/repair protein RecF [Methylovulum sp.]MCF8000095.1 DNA replication/repair protein RecF [Methylovulum sp.]